MSTKSELENLKNENSNLTTKLQNYGEDKNRLVDKIHQLELQLVNCMEKHKICQYEVKLLYLLSKA